METPPPTAAAVLPGIAMPGDSGESGERCGARRRRRRRNRPALQAAAALLLIGATVLVTNNQNQGRQNDPANGATSSLRSNLSWLSSDPPALRSLRIETIAPGRQLHSSYLSSRIESNPHPTTSGRQCESHYHPAADRYIDQVGVAVPPNSKFERNNNFHTVVDYNGLNVLVVGDSVGENMALFLANSHGGDGDDDLDGTDLDDPTSDAELEAAGFQPVVSPSAPAATDDDGGDQAPPQQQQPRQVDALGMRGMDVASRIHFAAESNLEGKVQDKIWINEVPADRGGGYVAFGRILTLWHGAEIDHAHLQDPTNSPADFVKWDPTQYDALAHQYGDVDVLIYRTPWPWMMKSGKLGKIQEDDYYKVLEVARRMVNPRTVIFATSAVNNNALKLDGFDSLRKDNAALRRFVANYRIPDSADRGVPNVLLMDFEKLTDALVLANAETMSIPPEMAFKHQVSCEGLSKGHAFTGTRYCPHLTAMACAGTTAPNHPEVIQTCVEDRRGRISPDGMHWCSATTQPRTAGGIVCLTKCAITADMSFEQDDREHREERASYLRECQDRCNDLWMNLDSYFVGEGGGRGHLELPATTAAAAAAAAAATGSGPPLP